VFTRYPTSVSLGESRTESLECEAIPPPAGSSTIYTTDGANRATEMSRTIRRGTLFALYQLTVFVGIALLPVAMMAQRLGVPLPVGRAVEGTKAAYESSK